MNVVLNVICYLFLSFTDVCGPTQCYNGAGCLVSLDNRGEFQYACECSALGDAKLLPVTMACKVANNNKTYDNHLSARRASCFSKAFLTFMDACDGKPPLQHSIDKNYFLLKA